MQRTMVWFAAAALALGATGCVTILAKDERIVMKTADGSTTGFINKTLDNGYRYVVYVPRDYTPDKEWPLAVFLHGAGERGGNGLAQTDVGIGRAIRFHPDRFPAIVLMPQCPKDQFWNSIWDELHLALERCESEYRIDADRVSLTGLSMGGYGTWLWGGVEAERFSAFMPICGGGEIPDSLAEKDTGDLFGTLDERVRQLATTPIWAFHGGKDTVVPPEQSREMVDLVRAAGGDVKYTEFAEAGHNSWDEAYDMEKAIKWLLKQRR